MDIWIIAFSVVAGVLLLAALPALMGAVLPIRYLGMKRLRVELQRRGIVPDRLGAQCLKDLLDKAEGPDSLPDHLSFVQRRGQYYENVVSVADTVAQLMGQYGPDWPVYDDVIARVLQRHNVPIALAPPSAPPDDSFQGFYRPR